jgi:hypothetical protein
MPGQSNSNRYALSLCFFGHGFTFAQADFGLSTSDADRVVTKARTGQLQVEQMHADN